MSLRGLCYLEKEGFCRAPKASLSLEGQQHRDPQGLRWWFLPKWTRLGHECLSGAPNSSDEAEIHSGSTLADVAMHAVAVAVVGAAQARFADAGDEKVFQSHS